MSIKVEIKETNNNSKLVAEQPQTIWKGRGVKLLVLGVAAGLFAATFASGFGDILIIATLVIASFAALAYVFYTLYQTRNLPNQSLKNSPLPALTTVQIDNPTNQTANEEYPDTAAVASLTEETGPIALENEIDLCQEKVQDLEPGSTSLEHEVETEGFSEGTMLLAETTPIPLQNNSEIELRELTGEWAKKLFRSHILTLFNDVEQTRVITEQLIPKNYSIKLIKNKNYSTIEFDISLPKEQCASLTEKGINCLAGEKEYLKNREKANFFTKGALDLAFYAKKTGLKQMQFLTAKNIRGTINTDTKTITFEPGDIRGEVPVLNPRTLISITSDSNEIIVTFKEFRENKINDSGLIEQLPWGTEDFTGTFGDLQWSDLPKKL